jgi:hypothetical protein
MLDREIGLPGPQPEPSALLPTPSKALVDLQSAIDQRNGRVDILAEVSERVGGICENLRVTPRARRAKSTPSPRFTSGSSVQPLT